MGGRDTSSETAVRDALASLQGRIGRSPHEVAWSGERLSNNIAGAVLAAIIALTTGTALLVGAHESAECPTMTVGFAGAAPAYLRPEFEAAAREIADVSGLNFVVESTEHPQLVVTWSNVGVVPAGRTEASGSSGGRFIGFGTGHWQASASRRELVRGVINVDANRAWQLGLRRGDALAAVLVHELGHVVGLEHSVDPQSFMYDRPRAGIPRWTAEDRTQLAALGRRSGCVVVK